MSVSKLFTTLFTQLVIASLFLSALVNIGSASANTDRNLVVDTRTLLESNEPTSSDHLALYFVEDNQSPVSRIITPAVQSNLQPLICDNNMIKDRAAEHFSFTSFTSECQYLGGDKWKVPGPDNVDPQTSFIAGVISGIGNCQINPDSTCISSIKITWEDGSQENLTPTRAIHDHYNPLPSTYDGSDKSGYPGGSSPWIWKSAKSGVEYLPLGSVLTWYNRPGSKDRRELNLGIYPVVQSPRQTSQCGSGIAQGSDFSSYCRISFKDEKQISIKLRVPNDLSGWLSGRVVNPVAYIEKFNNNYDELIIEGAPAETIVAGKWIKIDNSLTDYLNKSLWWKNFNNTPKTQYGNFSWPGALVDIANQSVKIFTDLEKEIGDVALANVPTWSVSMRSTNLPSCSVGKSGIQGLVATNAALYSSGAPLWDEKTKTLQYEVAAPRLRANRSGPNIGNYGLAMPASLFKCIYSVDQIPEFAEVSISYGDGRESNLASVSLKTVKDWVYLNADNFTFSAPTISVKLNDLPSKSTESNTVANSEEKSNAAKEENVISSKKKKLIQCVKGKKIKKIKATKLVCPKGYQIIR
jgi:hypothetical protein